MTASSVSAPSGPPAAAAAVPAPRPAAPPLRFADVLEALNPLQYLPVVGTIYRAVTGDTIPEGLRIAGSFLVSGLISGPIGILTTAVITIAEKVSGIDPERIGRTLLAEVGVGKPAAAPVTASEAAHSPAAPVTASEAKQSPAASLPAPSAGWSVAQLSQEGVTFGTDDTPRWHGLGGADALNGVELSRLRTAVAAYARVAALAS